MKNVKIIYDTNVVDDKSANSAYLLNCFSTYDTLIVYTGTISQPFWNIDLGPKCTLTFFGKAYKTNTAIYLSKDCNISLLDVEEDVRYVNKFRLTKPQVYINKMCKIYTPIDELVRLKYKYCPSHDELLTYEDCLHTEIEDLCRDRLTYYRDRGVSISDDDYQLIYKQTSELLDVNNWYLVSISSFKLALEFVKDLFEVCEFEEISDKFDRLVVKLSPLDIFNFDLFYAMCKKYITYNYGCNNENVEVIRMHSNKNCFAEFDAVYNELSTELPQITFSKALLQTENVNTNEKDLSKFNYILRSEEASDAFKNCDLSNDNRDVISELIVEHNHNSGTVYILHNMIENTSISFKPFKGHFKFKDGNCGESIVSSAVYLDHIKYAINALGQERCYLELFNIDDIDIGLFTDYYIHMCKFNRFITNSVDTANKLKSINENFKIIIKEFNSLYDFDDNMTMLGKCCDNDTLDEVLQFNLNRCKMIYIGYNDKLKTMDDFHDAILYKIESIIHTINYGGIH